MYRGVFSAIWFSAALVAVFHLTALVIILPTTLQYQSYDFQSLKFFSNSRGILPYFTPCGRKSIEGASKEWDSQSQATIPFDELRSITWSNKPSVLPDKYVKYDNHVVLRFNISTAEELKALSKLALSHSLDLWEVSELGHWADIRLAKDKIESLLVGLPRAMRTRYTELIPNLTQLISESYMGTASGIDNFFFKDYQKLSAISTWMKLLESMFPSYVKLISLGLSFENRTISALRVGVHPTGSSAPNTKRKTIIVTGGSHAREWISVSSVAYAAYRFIVSYGKSKDITKLVNEIDWVFVPTVNPDGYEYSWETDRLWRKNRQVTTSGICRGIDVDRGFGFEWDGESTKGNFCSESYAGKEAFEAVESKRIADWAKNEVDNNNARILGFVDLHSYSQQILYPYSYSCVESPPSLEDLEELALGLAKSIRVKTGEHYGVTSACEGNVGWRRTEIGGGGSALDWFYHVLQVKYCYQIKLRDQGSYGFLLPEKNIIPTGDEAFAAMKDMGDFVLSNKGIENIELSDSEASHEIVEVMPDRMAFDAIEGKETMTLEL